MTNMRVATKGADYRDAGYISGNDYYQALKPILFIGAGVDSGDAEIGILCPDKTTAYKHIRSGGIWFVLVPQGYYWHPSSHTPGNWAYYVEK